MKSTNCLCVGHKHIVSSASTHFLDSLRIKHIGFDPNAAVIKEYFKSTVLSFTHRTTAGSQLESWLSLSRQRALTGLSCQRSEGRSFGQPGQKRDKIEFRRQVRQDKVGRDPKRSETQKQIRIPELGRDIRAG